jgi:ubiquinone/menaquinone biosynthesis C-methylase UbiE
MPRRPRKDQGSVRYHNRVARKYDGIYDNLYWRFHDDLTWHAVRPHLPTDATARCLDLGCGTGKWGLKLQKSGFATTFVDHAPAMIGEVRGKIANPDDAIVGDIVDLPMLPGEAFALTLAMGDPLSICSDPPAAAGEMFRTCQPGGVVIATADNRTAAPTAYLERGDLDGLEDFLRTGRTSWVTSAVAEQFPLATFTPAGLRKLFEAAGFEVLKVTGNTVLPIRRFRELLEDKAAYKRLLKLELDLQKDPSTAAAAGHLQITARRP